MAHAGTGAFAAPADRRLAATAPPRHLLGPAVNAAWSLAAAVTAPDEDDGEWQHWWARLEAAEEIAVLTRARFAQPR